MTWITIPNEIVLGFIGKPVRGQKLNDDLDYLFRPLKCLSEGCEFSTTTLREWEEHHREEHDGKGPPQISLSPEMEDRNAAWIILELLLAFNRQDSPQRPNPLRRIQRGNDSFHSAELWRRVWNSRKLPNVRVKKEQYEWLHQVLDRKLPISLDPKEAKERKDLGEEPQSVGMYFFGLSEDTVRQALTTLPDRRQREAEESEQEPREAT